MSREQLLLAALGLAAGLNLVAFAAWGIDKRRAAREARRVPERRLLLLGALGPLGAWAGVFAFRHKTQKTWFLVRLALVSALLPLLGAGGFFLLRGW